MASAASIVTKMNGRVQLYLVKSLNEDEDCGDDDIKC